MGRVQDKVAIVTGGSAGIGRACAITLAGEGASVAVTDVQDPEGDAVVAEINTAGGKAIYLHHDVTSEAEWQTVLEQILQEYKHLDILVNNAGIAISSPITQLSLEDFQRQNAVNLDGVFLGLKHCIPAMTESGGGSIINMASVASSVKGIAHRAVYGVSKAAVVGLTKSVAADYVAQGVRCNAIAPGTVETPSLQDRINAFDDPVAARAAFIARQPLGRLGKAEEIAAVALYLAADESVYTTGQVFSVDGGITI